MGSPGEELRERLQVARGDARRAVNRIDSEPVRRARGLVRALHRDPPDVLYLGDSTTSFVGPEDTDRRRLKTMIADGLGTGVSVRTIDGASFSTDIFGAYLELVRDLPRPPVIVLPLWIRGRFPPWIHHPVHGNRRAIARIRRIDPGQPAWRVHASFPKPTAAEFEAFKTVPYRTMLGDGCVGDYVSAIRQFEREGNEDERVRMLYNYHHGGALTIDTPELASVTRLGQTVQRLGCRVVVYQTPSPVEMGAQLLGEGIRTRTVESFRALNAAYRAGAGDGAAILETGTMFSSAQFIDPSDASEHINESGRLPLAALIIAATQEHL